MCNCFERTEKEYKEYLKQNDPFFKDLDIDVEFENKAFMFGSGKTEITLPLEIKWKHTAKSGRITTKRKIRNFTTSYCPFCGEKKEESEDK